MLTRLARDNPAKLYEMLLKEQAKTEVEYISKAAQNFLNAVRGSLDEIIDDYKEEYGENWQEAIEGDWQYVYTEVLSGHQDKLLEYFRNII